MGGEKGVRVGIAKAAERKRGGGFHVGLLYKPKAVSDTRVNTKKLQSAADKQSRIVVTFTSRSSTGHAIALTMG